MGTATMETAITTKPNPKPAPALPAASPRPESWYCLAAALGSSALLWMSFQPLALGTYLGWIALVPFLVLVRANGARTVYLCAFACGLAFFVPALSWMRVADRAMIGAWLTLSVYCALYFPAALFVIRVLDRGKLPLVVSAPLAWAVFEHLRCWALTGFPWYLLAHTQHDFLAMIQITDIGGVYLVTLVVAAVNALLFDIAYQFPEVRARFGLQHLEPYRYYASLDVLNRGKFAEYLMRRNLILEGAAVALVLIGTFAYGQYRLGQNHFTQGPTVALLQSNIDQRLRENQDKRSVEAVTRHFSELILASLANPRPDILIWPETSYPRPWFETSRELPIGDEPTDWRDEVLSVRFAVKDLARTTRAPHLLGMNSVYLDAKGKRRAYNSALLVSPYLNDKKEVVGQIDGKFDKIHRVPFGEFLPFRGTLPFLSYLTPYPEDFGIDAGEKHTRFKIGKHHFGVLLCYEDTDPFMARRYLEETDDGPPVDFLVNMSNDGWFDGSSEHEEHLAVSRFRAIECRRSLIRSVNMGVSAVIDSNGRVLAPRLQNESKPASWIITHSALGVNELPVSQWHQYKKQAGILKAIVPIDQRYSFYAATGHLQFFGFWAVWVLMHGGMAWGLGVYAKTGGSPTFRHVAKTVLAAIAVGVGAYVVGGFFLQLACAALFAAGFVQQVLARRPSVMNGAS